MPFNPGINTYICNMKFTKYLALLSLVFTLIFSSCRKDELLTASSAKLDFSTDSVLFDTVFTTIGSTTKIFRIYNRHVRPMNISRIFLATGPASPFKLNVDGISGKSITDVEIGGGDSLYVFVQVTIDPNNLSSPLLVKDSIVFETNGNLQDVKLTAVGQDVYLHKPDHFPTNGLPAYSITGREHHDTILPNDKPHLFFGYTVIDSDCELTMQAGTKCYFYNNAVLWVFDDGTLIVNGTQHNEVTFQGYRLESDYRETPGQWGKIWLSKGSKNNVIDWAIIKNGGIGIQVDSVATPGTPSLKLSNTIIKNMTAAAVYGKGAHIWSNNCMFANCGQYVAALTIGGKYKFEHCTFANYWSVDQRTTPVLAMNNYFTNGGVTFVRPLDSCKFVNCILYGDIPEEIGIDSVTGAGGSFFSYNFDHCLVKTQRNTGNSHYNACFANIDPAFKDVSENNYELRSTSGAIDKGELTFIVNDLNGKPRPNPGTSIPDNGAYEFY